MTDKGRKRIPGSAKLSHATDAGLGKGNSARSQLVGIAWITGFVIALAVGVTIVADPRLRIWGLVILGLLILALSIWSWRRRRNRASLSETLTDLSQR